MTLHDVNKASSRSDEATMRQLKSAWEEGILLQMAFHLKLQHQPLPGSLACQPTLLGLDLPTSIIMGAQFLQSACLDR